MKKLTVMAACAALLLGGGCFLKVNQMNLSLLENIEAFSEGGEQYRGPGEPGSKETTVSGLTPGSMYYPANAYPVPGPFHVGSDGCVKYSRMVCNPLTDTDWICEETQGTVAMY